ncbi:zinc ABC transporter substrate-binding protein [Fusobacterium naviforme]|uniref:Zinc transport system substrate-binding protein n=1 Tax=Moryella indoligenes TaxID=371674 RepID=A0AAE3VB72_9FIRM|nr:metal ABC transporter substrate-binding protein [Moryella indoligenes]KAB0578585.1 zinc ABC transporter substrate-binding protein [Fusobacterium naviforme]MDQ0153107.1 zinc transport system substrate-binding protein [Moryella indoligenes]
MKKNIAAIMTASVLAVSALAGCGSSAKSAATTTAAETAAKAEESRKLSIVTTIYPEYDWVKEILGSNAEHAELTMLLDNGVDLHSYQPTAEDIMKIADSDLFIYVGGESDGWVEDALKEATNEDMKVINLLETLGENVKEEEMVEGMQEGEHHHDHGEEHDHEDGDHDHEHEGAEAEHDHEDGDHDHEHEGAEAEHDHEDGDHDHEHESAEAEHDHEHGEAEHEHHHDHGDEPEYDEHVWLSVRNAKVLCTAIEEALAELDAENAESYAANLKSYSEKLDSLDQEYQAAVDGAAVKTLLFGDRFPFRYLVDDYGLDYYAAFVGCSAETEASFETISFLSQKVDELGLKAIMTIEGPEHKIAETIKENTKTKDQQILTMDSMQATDAEDVAAGVSYLSIMTENLEVLKAALQ